MNNNGDITMLKTLLQRLRHRYIDAKIRIITNDPDGIKALDQRAEPVVVGDRRLWQVTQALSIPNPEEKPFLQAAFRLDEILSRTLPDEYYALLAEITPTAYEARQGWEQALNQSDVIFLMGGGYFTDAFAEHAAHLLMTLREGIRRNVPTFIIGGGFEPISDFRLKQIASDVLPHVTAITCREALTSPGVLSSFNVAPEQFAITGDDAIEMANIACPAALGDRIGVSLRDHIYNPIDAGQYQTIRTIIERFAANKHAALQPAPISNYLPSDMDAIQRVLPENDNGNSDESVLDTPERLLTEIAHCRIMITGSYHAAVFALSMGIPSICLTRSSHYQYKMSGLLSMFGANPEKRVIALDDANFAAKLDSVIHSAWINADAERPLLLTAAKDQIKRGLAAYTQIFETIDAAHLKQQPKQNAATDTASDESKAMFVVLRELVHRIKQLQHERDYLQFHADERLKIIEHLQANQMQIDRSSSKTPNSSWFKKLSSRFL
jgi:polysaccharide pyruvyl transferase WcaK-like protein